MFGQKHKYLFLVLPHVIQVLSFPMDSFVYEANPIQKISFKYDDKNSSMPLKFKLQTASFRIYEQLDGLNSDKKSSTGDRSQKSNLNAKEIEEKYKQLSRFTVFYTPEDNILEKSITNNHKKNKPDIINNHGIGSAKVIKEDCEDSENERRNIEGSTAKMDTISNTEDSNQFDIDITTDYASNSTMDSTEYNPSTDVVIKLKRDQLFNKMTNDTVDYST